MGDRFYIDSETSLQKLVSMLSRLSVGNGEEWEISVQRKRALRTNQQLKTYWRWLRLIADKTGSTPDDVDNALRLKYAPEQINLDGVDQVIPGDVSKYDTVRFAEYLDWIYEWAWSQLAVDLSCIKAPEVDRKAVPILMDFSDAPDWSWTTEETAVASRG